MLLIAIFVKLCAISQSTNVDSVHTVVDTLNKSNLQQNTPPPKKKSSTNLTSTVDYYAKDSLINDRENQKVFLYHEAVVNYDGIILKAEYIELDFKNNTVYAIGIPDSTGKMIGNPIFNDNGEEYQASIIRYNFETKKGLISDVKKNEDDVYIWLKKGKKMPNDITYVQTGHFTTCSAEHPHYRVRFKKGKIIPNDKIVTGPIYMEVEDIPLPMMLPFGFIPNTSSRANGILFPSYGYTENRGYRITDGGYYWGLGKNADLQLRGDIYSRGSWGVKALARYNFRYQGKGYFDLKYAFNKYGETDAGNYNEDKGYFIKWKHTQDAKANPYSTFSANVNFGSTKYNRLNSTNSANYLNNNFASSISYIARFGKGYNFSASLNHSQNTKTGIIDISLPQIAFGTPQYNPLRRKKAIGPKKWYENISLSYKMNAQNNLQINDSLFSQTKWEDFDNAIKHTIPISSSVSSGNFNWTNSVTFTERWYFSSTNKYYENDTTYVGVDTIAPHLVTEKQRGFNAVHFFNYHSSVNTHIYGMYMMKGGPIIAMRHVLTPTLSFDYHPDFGKQPFNYFHEYTNEKGEVIRYNLYENQMYGATSDGKSGSIGFSLANTFELKVRSRKDTVNGGTKKIKLIEGLTLSTSYNLAAKEFALNPLRLSARTTLFKGMNISYNALWDFYALDSLGKRINKFIWEVKPGNYIRKSSGDYQLSFNYNLNSNTFNKKNKKKKDYKSEKGTDDELKEVNAHKDAYVDFNNAWQANFSYKFQYTETLNTNTLKLDHEVVQTVNFRGSINITKKWKIGGSSGWDFKANKMTYSSIDIYRDLHCWELMFNWIPMGYNKSYNLTIRVKSPMLQDLKLNRKRNWRDY